MTVSLDKIRNGWIVNLDTENEFSTRNIHVFLTSKAMYDFLHENVGD